MNNCWHFTFRGQESNFTLKVLRSLKIFTENRPTAFLVMVTLVFCFVGYWTTEWKWNELQKNILIVHVVDARIIWFLLLWATQQISSLNQVLEWIMVCITQVLQAIIQYSTSRHQHLKALPQQSYIKYSSASGFSMKISRIQGELKLLPVLLDLNMRY